MHNVVCLKYGTKYSAEYVNALHEGVKNHSSLPFRFVCFTDDSAGVKCETYPIPADEIGWWGKLSLFQKQLYDLQGTLLFIDLDMHITGSLDDYFLIGDPHDFYMMRDFVWKTEYSSAIMRFPVGEYDAVWNYYKEIKSKIPKKIGDQNVINLLFNSNIQSRKTLKISHLRTNLDGRTIKFFPDVWQQDIYFSMRYDPERLLPTTKVVVEYGSTGRTNLKFFMKS